jgi:signal transduction histidine kinase
VPLIAVAAYSFYMVIKTTRNDLSWKIRLTSEEIAKDLGEHFNSTFNVINALAKHPAVKNMDSVESDQIFAELLPLFPLHLNILTARLDGFNAGSAIDPQNAHKLNYKDKEWFQRSISGERLIGDLHISKLVKSSAIMVAAPVYADKSSVKGVIGFPLNLDELREKIIKDWQLPPESIIIISDTKGNILVDTQHKEHVGKNLAHFPLFQTAHKTSNGFIEMAASDGIKRLFYVTTPKDTDWRVIVGIPTISFIKNASISNSPILIAIVIATILGLILTILLGHRLSSNISDIVVGIKSIGDGNLEHRLELKGRDELADIAIYFNEMAEKQQQDAQEIKRMNAQLELRVEERTAQLVAANKELDSFSYSVSHDLQAPLRSISGFSDILLEEYGDKLETQAKDCVERIHNASTRMSSLINELLQLSRINRLELNRQTVDLSGMALQIAEELKESNPKRQVEFKISSAITAEADVVLIRSVMENLLGNAWKFTQHSANPVIMFDAKRENESITYFIKDNGAGFNPDDAGRLFNPFQRLHTNAEFEGTGIGLATAQRIIHRHDGQIWAKGKVQEGAAFYFTL